MKISIIIPIYNCEEYISDCLASLIDQGIPPEDYEIICIDDGSVDQSIRIVEEFAAINRNIIVIKKNNEGIAATRNLGLDYAKGEYIVFVDADDFLESNILCRILKILEGHHDTLVRFSYECVANSSHYTADEGHNMEYEVRRIADNEIPFPVWGMIIPRRVVEDSNIRFNPIFRNREDRIFNILLFSYLYGRPYIRCAEKAYKYRDRKNSLSHKLDYHSDSFHVARTYDILNYVKECESYLNSNCDLSTDAVKCIRRHAAFYGATAIIASLRSKTVDSEMIKNEVEKLGYYPYPLGLIRSKAALEKAILTFPPIFRLFQVTSFLNLKTKA